VYHSVRCDTAVEPVEIGLNFHGLVIPQVTPADTRLRWTRPGSLSQ
jgi:hypothetical protein